MRRLAYLSAMITPLAALLVLVEPNAASALPPTRYVDILFPEPEALIETKNVVYGVVPNNSTDPDYLALHGDPMALLLDIYQPPASDTDRDRGLYIWTHGGNFRVGSKNISGSHQLRDYVRRGWVGISIDYRLRPELPGNAAVGALIEPASLPAFIDETKDAQHDLQAAIRWARANAEFLGIDPTRIGIGGISAGAITSLMVAFNPEDPGTSGTPNQPSKVAAAVSHAGTYAPVLLGRFPMPGDPPIAMYHGGLDEQVPYPTPILPCLLTLAVGNDCEYVTFVGERHGTFGTDLARDFLYRHVIQNRSALPLAIGQDPISVFAGAEPQNLNFGATVGVFVTDPERTSTNLQYLVNYVANALGLDKPFPE
ncbi:MAG: alpha/beta hydrolase [Candidatus Binatia bacterium]